ncbi:MAG: hypothetical protein ONB11_05320 [candidate division KSB1 bacterium]|nr:hypothetical protein [candidate division KSB1 bacterium]
MRKSISLLWPFVLSILLNLILGGSECGSRSLACFRFDAGAENSAVQKRTILLTPDMIYEPRNGFGWLARPDRAFVRSGLERSRSEFTIDGVVGQEISFRADLTEGNWWLTLWLEAGVEDSSTVSIAINGEKRNLHWQAFAPPAEGRTEIQYIYRLFHGHVAVHEDGLQFLMTCQRDSVRLLGFTLMPDPLPNKPIHHQLIGRFKQAGRYGATLSLDSLLIDLKKLSAQQPRDNFIIYWVEQIELLSLAEQLKNMMGWSWATQKTGMGIFDRYHQALMLLDGLLDRPDAEKYYFYERALWLRGTLLYWLGEERHGQNEIKGARRDLAALYQRYPHDPLLAMYNGKKIDQPDPCDQLEKTSGAPLWSLAQREALCRLRHIAHWWVKERQAPNGELGGKLDDDVESLRWWTPLILAGDTIAFNGWRKLADGVWNSPDVYQGYCRHARDVEHASEYIADTAPDMILFSDDPLFLERLQPSLHYFDTLWTAITPKGHRFFRSTWFSSREVITDPPRNRDHEYNTRAVKAIRYFAWRTHEPEAIQLLHEWSLAWVNAAMRTDKGKPTGIIPASVRFPDEALNADEPTWYKANMFWDYYDWEAHKGSMMLDQLLFTYTLTQDTTLLTPLFASLNLISSQEGSQHSNEKNAPRPPGSPEWAVAKLRDDETFWSVVGQWRFISGDTRYDHLIHRYGSPYLRYRLTGDENHLLEGLQVLLESVRYNVPLLTYEVLHTDRVYVRGAHHLKAMLTGDGVPEGMSPYYAVSWEGTDENFTALVTESGKDHLSVQIYSHSNEQDEINMRLWQLAPGTYQLTYRSEQAAHESKFLMREKGQRIALVLPARSLLEVRIY